MTTAHHAQDTRAFYDSIRAVNWSTLKHMGDSPLHYRHNILHPKEQADAMLLGSAVHTALLEPDRLPLEYAIWTGGQRRGKEWEQFKDANAGRDILREQDYADVCAIRDAVRSNPVAAPYLLAPGPCETTRTWTEPTTGTACKGRLDKIASVDGRRVLVDVKTARDIRARLFGSQAARLGYHGQLAFYFDGLAAAGEPVESAVIVAVENKAPFDAAVFVATEDVLWAGREEYQALLRRLAECQSSGQWPGRYIEEQELVLPAWLYEDETEADDGLIVEE